MKTQRRSVYVIPPPARKRLVGLGGAYNQKKSKTRNGTIIEDEEDIGRTFLSEVAFADDDDISVLSIDDNDQSHPILDDDDGVAVESAISEMSQRGGGIHLSPIEARK